MEQQLKANSVRIRVLQQENASLSNSLARLKDREEKQRSSDSGIVEMDREAVAMGPLDSSSTSSPTSPSSILHHQTLCLSLHQDVEERYMNIRQAARIRSAGTRRRRKWCHLTDWRRWPYNGHMAFYECWNKQQRMLYELDLQNHAVQQMGWKIFLLVNISGQNEEAGWIYVRTVSKWNYLCFVSIITVCEHTHMGYQLQEGTWQGEGLDSIISINISIGIFCHIMAIMLVILQGMQIWKTFEVLFVISQVWMKPCFWGTIVFVDGRIVRVCISMGFSSILKVFYFELI